MSISNCGHDERWKYCGGKAGDQTKTEYRVRSWYSIPMKCVLRYPDEKVGKKIAAISKDAANNENIGYDQYQRMTYYNELKAANWKPKRIKKKCESDCSASTAANVIAAGHQLKLPKLQKVNPNCTTFNLRAALKEAGFKVLTDSKYLTSEDYLLPGDILLNDEHHVAVNLTKGSKVGKVKKSHATKKEVPKVASASINLRKGSAGNQVGYLQQDLSYLGFKGRFGKKLVVDKDFGVNTEHALRAFQKKHHLTVDGVYGKESYAKMKSLIK